MSPSAMVLAGLVCRAHMGAVPMPGIPFPHGDRSLGTTGPGDRGRIGHRTGLRDPSRRGRGDRRRPRPGRRLGQGRRRRGRRQRRRRRPDRPRCDRRARPGRRRPREQRRAAARGPRARVPGRPLLDDPHPDARGAVPAGPRGAAAHVRARLGPGGQRQLDPRPAGLGVQVRVRDREARPRGPVQGDRPRGRRARRHVQLREPGLRPNAARRGADRRPGTHPRTARGARGRGRDAGAGGGQAADRAGRGRRGGRLAVLPRGGLGDRHLPGDGRRVERPLMEDPLPAAAHTLAAASYRGPEGLPAVAEYLRLVLDDAAAIEYEAPLVRARATGADAARLAGLEQVKLLALQVREAFAVRRRRESELSALFDTAGDLAALRSVDSVLTAIVRRARQLLGTDVSYLTLHDVARGDTYMRVTDGSVSARFQALRLPMGAGLGGLVAQTSAPYATASYFTDDRFRHTSEINTGVQEEGLVAILGVPLVRGSQVIGVLFAADRSERSFDRAEVALLGSLAAHAAIALDNARLLEETRTALEELSATTRALRTHTASVERAAEAHDRFVDLVLQGGGVDDVAAALTEVLGGRLAVLGEDGRPTGPDDGTPLPEDPATALGLARTTGRTVREGDTWTAAVTAGGELLGGLVLHREELLSESDQRILERAALVTALLLLIRRTAGEAENRVRGELLEELLGAKVRDPEGLRERARRLGADLDQPLAVVVARVDERAVSRALAGATHLAATRGGLAALHDGAVVLCLPDLTPAVAAATVRRELGIAGADPVTVGGAGPVRGPAAVAAAYTEALRCTATLVALGRTGDSASAAELGFFGLLVGEGRDVGCFVESTLAPVLEYDARRGTDLVATLQAYFQAGASPARAAEALQVHVNTVTQRLERVSRLIGKDWSTPDRALEIQLALRLHRLTGTSEG